MPTTADATCSSSGAATVAIMSPMSADERYAFYCYMWMRALQSTLPGTYPLDIINASYNLADSSDWIGSETQQQNRELASMYDLYGLMTTFSGDALSNIRAQLGKTGLLTTPAAILRSRINVAKCNFWRGNTFLPVVHG